MNRTDLGVALVTGASTGIGRATARSLKRAGYRVFGTSRKAADGNPDGITMLVCDVTDDASVQKMVAEVINKAGRIDLLVNNAGIGVVGGAEESSFEQCRSIFETNVFGCIRIIKAVLPHMRSQGEGRIINISSVLGRIPAPFMALYSATKHALEGYSESMDHEIRKFNVRSILIEPAYTKTNFDQNSVMADRPLSIYEKARNGMIELTRQAMTTADAADVVAKTVVKAATALKPRVRYTSGSLAAKIVTMRRFVPEALYDSGVRKTFRLDE
jgi:NAD(P)-dependent dehydrogenase (short-subunit alcohol dehydrogenase family)